MRLIIVFRGMICRLAPSQECYIYFIIPNIISLFSNRGAEVPKTMQCVIATNGGNNEWVAFVNRLSA